MSADTAPLDATPLDPDAATDIAIRFHLDGNHDEAEQRYRSILDACPNHAITLHFLGVLLHQNGQSDNAIVMLRKSLERQSQNVDWHNDLANVLAQLGRNEEAIDAFMSALNLDQANAVVWNNLGAVLQRSGLPDDAVRCFDNAIALEPAFADALNNLGNALTALGEEQRAAQCFCRAYVMPPHGAKPKGMLGIAYYTLGRIAEAASAYRQWLDEEPGNPIAAHMLAACSGTAVPERATDDYLEAHFDQLAEGFDAKLTRNLSYQVPALVGQLLQRLAIGEKTLAILDAGCGTGLCGPYLAPYARHLTGVDLSEMSLAVAADKGMYDELVKAELTDYLSRKTAPCDLIVMADTLIYFGKLEKLLVNAASALRSDGLLIASVEEMLSSSVDGYNINPSGRYSHRRAYLVDTLSASGFEVQSVEPIDIRIELGNAVSGLLVVARKQG